MGGCIPCDRDQHVEIRPEIHDRQDSKPSEQELNVAILLQGARTMRIVGASAGQHGSTHGSLLSNAYARAHTDIGGVVLSSPWFVHWCLWWGVMLSN